MNLYDRYAKAKYMTCIPMRVIVKRDRTCRGKYSRGQAEASEPVGDEDSYIEAMSVVVIGGWGSKETTWDHFEEDNTGKILLEVALKSVDNAGEEMKAESGTTFAQSLSKNQSSHTRRTRSMMNTKKMC